MAKSATNLGDDIETHQWARERYPGIRVYKSTYTNFQFPRHFHNYFTIQVVDEGVNCGFTNHLHYQLGIDTVLIINPGEIHAGASKDANKLSFTVITIEENILRELLLTNHKYIHGDIIFDNRPIVDIDLVTKIRLFVTAFRSEAAEVDLRIKLIEWLHGLSRYLLNGARVSKVDIGRNYVVKAHDFIRENYQKEIALHDIASNCGVSEYHLLREFKANYGLTPFEYLRNFRVEKARELLRENSSITQIALQVGFYDHSHFLKNFKKITGMLPSQSRT